MVTFSKLANWQKYPDWTILQMVASCVKIISDSPDGLTFSLLRDAVCVTRHYRPPVCSVYHCTTYNTHKSEKKFEKFNCCRRQKKIG